jgi:hypothetical protein
MQVLGIVGRIIQGGYRLVADLEGFNFLLRTHMEKYFNTKQSPSIQMHK